MVIFSFISKCSGIVKQVHVYVIIIIIMTLFIMFGLEKPLKQRIRNGDLERTYKAMNKSEIYRKRALALFLLIFSYILMFWALIMIFSK